ncbi:hypothetical protein DCO58_08565 [Helicobacter saguini]|uniref:Uncharacterized protein n=1 Tax=Helicobacter saguini TaxID=1548018 RepID=A0A6B0HUJ2_9HELI|nr:hypothetical protein [Helicobacter saguini]MWV61624.1 hypothetical protein [Helicobacter saguini]MWV67704.1 hypothetical protein [Helicobacter saguini]MWV70056.1 hypothetical protein [Helicobacter saguini]MWV72731.1 hypothetical protein [Helicobacter saguini]
MLSENFKDLLDSFKDLSSLVDDINKDLEISNNEIDKTLDNVKVESENNTKGVVC